MRNVTRTGVALALIVLASACGTPPGSAPPPVAPPPVAPSAATPEPPVVRHAVPPPAPESKPSLAKTPPVVVPAGVQYLCVVDHDGKRRETAIEFSDKVAGLCRKHPEMGPCQYERDMCRRAGGRVYTGNNEEITLATEAEYDKKVMRVRFKSN